MKKRLNKKHRAVSEVISTMLLLSIAVVGASLLTIFVNNFFQSSNIGHMESSPAKSLYLLSYDTRDYTGLMAISNLNNYNGTVNGKLLLCGKSCNGTPNNIPSANGTEFFVIQLVNKNAASVYPDKIYVNNVAHTWDEKAVGVAPSDLSSYSIGAPSPHSYPETGKFSIFSPTGSHLQVGREIKGGNTVNILIKLGATVDDIYPDNSFQIKVNIGELNSKEFVIQGGAAQ